MIARVFAALALALSLSGCGIGVVGGFAIAASAFEIAKDVVGIDVSLQQNTPGKTPLKALISPPPAEPQK